MVAGGEFARSLWRAFAVAVLASLLGLGLAGNADADPSPFLTGGSVQTSPTPPGGLNHPIGLAVQGTRLLETDECNDSVLAIDGQANVSILATLPHYQSDPNDPTSVCREAYITVAPPSLPTYGGQLIAPSENDNTIYAVSPTGTVSTVASSPAPEHINFVPANPCPLGQSGGAYFTANPDTTSSIIQQWPVSDFQGLAGQAIVAGEHGTVGVLS